MVGMVTSRRRFKHAVWADGWLESISTFSLGRTRPVSQRWGATEIDVGLVTIGLMGLAAD
jgi:hypothetical protein